jgi:chemotaxis-related protein WspD
LKVPLDDADQDFETVMVFRLADEWLALRVAVLVEVTTTRPIHRIPHRTGFLAGIANIRGELQLCARLDLVLGMKRDNDVSSVAAGEEQNKSRLMVVQSEGERWVFPVDEVDEVFRFPIGELRNVPATLARSHQRLAKGVFQSKGRAVGLLDDGRLFPLLRGKIR